MEVNHVYLEENSNLQSIKYEGNLNFSTATCSEDDWENGPYKRSKIARQDPLSHRIIEKRRRDRMNNCLADLSRLIPTKYLKKGRGRIEKTEIIEMAIKHMKYLQEEQYNSMQYYRLGYQECMSEAVKFMVEVEGHFPRESICIRLLKHLQNHCEQLSKPPEQTAVSADDEKTTTTTTTAEYGDRHHRYQSPLQTGDLCKPEFATTNGNNGGTPHHSKVKTEFEKHEEDVGGVSYKYKTSIKLRFNQDCSSAHSNGRRNSVTSLEQSPEHSSTVSSEYDNDLPVINQRRSIESATSTKEAKSLSPPSVVRCQNLSDNVSVPVFALHAQSSYYVPLTVDYKTLFPFLRRYNLAEDAREEVVLHPVTINVNFLPPQPPPTTNYERYKNNDRYD